VIHYMHCIYQENAGKFCPFCTLKNGNSLCVILERSGKWRSVSLQGITGHELCHYFWEPSVRLEWELTLEMSNVVSWLSRDTHITYQVLKRVWPAAQRDSLFWSTIRHCPSDDDDGPDYWVVVNYSTECVPIPQVCCILCTRCHPVCFFRVTTYLENAKYLGNSS